MKRNKRLSRFVVTAVLCVVVFAMTTMGLSASGDPAAVTADTAFTVGETAYDLSDGGSAMDYTSNYADNLQGDPAFEKHLDTALNKTAQSMETAEDISPARLALALALRSYADQLACRQILASLRQDEEPEEQKKEKKEKKKKEKQQQL